MPRRKGSKNKKTLERERLEASLKSNLEAQIPVQESQVEESTPDEEKPEIEVLNTIQDLPNEVATESKTTKKKTSLSKPKCERCGVEIDSEPYKVDTNVLTGRADYFRESTRYVKLCGKCSMELSKIVDNFLLSGECSEGIRKFPIDSNKESWGYKQKETKKKTKITKTIIKKEIENYGTY